MQQPYSLNLLRSTAVVIDLHQKFLVLHERVETAIIENAGRDKHILLKIVGGDKAIATQTIEEFDAARTSSSAGSAAADGSGETGLLTVSRSFMN